METDQNSQPSTARTLAHQILCEYRRTGRFVSEITEREFSQKSPSTPDRALITELVLGVVRHRITLEYLLNRFSRKRIKHAQYALTEALLLGLYQVMFLERIPHSAAINESVNIVRKRVGEHAVKFANGLLRAVARDFERYPHGEPNERSCPVSEGWAAFQTDIFPNPETDPVEYISAAYGHPVWLIGRWLPRFGEAVTQQICMANNARPSIHVRWRGQQEPNADFSPVDGLAGLYAVEMAGPVSTFPGFDKGDFIVQGQPGYRAVEALRIETGMDVLDLCSAPGAKAMHAADLLQGTGRLIAVDKSLRRMKKLKENQERLRIRNIQPIIGDATDLQHWLKGEFPRILLDVPCSNTGELCRRVESRHRLNADTIAGIAELQHQLLASAAGKLSMGGTLVYSTCSLEEEEGSSVVRGFLSEGPGFSQEEERWFLPHENGCAGGYLARIVRHA
ncbi:MAG: transcription antitermination factor NusB [Planctomycetota bacterium]|jgi:16S rRNA (cytosine967-C5)-methyltransferase|nr:transcription antitermination factor NusB [Planctomycetota bacterium]MDP7252225.1 transcription antitermination factor NusB [Planctomycetota bacterium]